MAPTDVGPSRVINCGVIRGIFAALVCATLVTGCSASPKAVTAQPASRTAVTTKPATTAATTAIPTSAAPEASSALGALAALPVKGLAPLTGYTRAQFGPAWTDDNDDPMGHNGCDTRNDILRRDLTTVTLKTGTHGCEVLTGSLADPYTATTIPFTRGASTSTAIQIDHVVALGDAWQTGAQQLTAQRRVDIGNDPLNLLAVKGSQNEAKGDSDAASWLPPNQAYQCSYVARQVAVKLKYGLWVTQAEHDAIAHVLATCPSQSAPTT